MWTIESEADDVLASFETEEAALAAFYNEAVLMRLSEAFADACEDYWPCELRLKHNGIEVTWH